MKIEIELKINVERTKSVEAIIDVIADELRNTQPVLYDHIFRLGYQQAEREAQSFYEDDY